MSDRWDGGFGRFRRSRENRVARFAHALLPLKVDESEVVLFEQSARNRFASRQSANRFLSGGDELSVSK
jgi:hypothetical protein